MFWESLVMRSGPPGGPERRRLSGVPGRRLTPAAALGHPAQSQHVKTDVAHPHRLVQIKLDDGDLLDGALVAQQAPTVAAAGGDRQRRAWLAGLGSRAETNAAALLTSGVCGW